jgi:uncharacterized protein (TIGR02996 family)
MSEAGLLAAIIDEPDDDTPRLVYADWLEEHGDDARAEFIRIQCRLARLGVVDLRRVRQAEWLYDSMETGFEAREFLRLPHCLRRLAGDVQRLLGREEELLAGHWKAWLGPLAELGEEWAWRRGFVEDVAVRADVLIDHADDLFRANPIRTLAVYELESALQCEHVFALPELARLTALALPGCEGEFDWVGFLANARHLTRLTALALNAAELDDAKIELLASLPHLGRLAELYLGNNNLGPAAVQALVSSPHLKELSFLSLRANPVEGCGEVLAAGANSPRLTTLDLGDGRITDEDVRALAHSDRLGGLRTLLLNWPWPDLTLGSLSALLSSPHLDNLSALHFCSDYGSDDQFRAAVVSCRLRLEILDLESNPIADAGADALAAAPSLQNLAALNLRSCGVGTAGVCALGNSPHLTQLAWLDLGHNRLDREAVAALAEGPSLGRLAHLDLRWTDLSADKIDILVRSPGLPSLRELELGSNDITDAGARLLAASPWVGRLEVLDLGFNEIGDEGARTLAASPHLDRLHKLDLGHNKITAAGKEVLRQRFGSRLEIW